VHIDNPGAGEWFLPGSQVIARGGAYDAEDNSLNGNALTWSVDGQQAGSGEDTILAGLLPGTHTLLLQAIDSDGQMGSAQITFDVSYRSFLPSLLISGSASAH
jgi:hypothetical protein